MNDTPNAKRDKHNIDLNDVMLTMDVVDTLRYRRQLVERELSAEDQDRAMIEKVRGIYADQGLEVSDEIIAEAVAALREERFTYKPPRSGFNTFLARMYVQRGRWGAVIGIAAAVLVCIVLVYRLAVVGPAKRRQAKAAETVEEAWQQFEAAALGADLAKAGRQRYDQALRYLEKGDTASAGREARTLEQMARLPAALDQAHTQVIAEAREDAARARAQSLYRQGMSALAAGDVAGAEAAEQSLAELLQRLRQAFLLRVVSTPNEPSGVWRVPPNNPAGRNFYIIVEALTPKGEAVSVPVTSEEDGQTRTVSKWGLRVREAVFERFKRDKMDDGIIQNNQFGAKRRGYLEIDYAVPTSGGAITEW